MLLQPQTPTPPPSFPPVRAALGSAAKILVGSESIELVEPLVDDDVDPHRSQDPAWALQGATGDPLAEQIHAALTSNPDGLTRTQLRDLFHRNQPAAHLDRALDTLAHTGRATRKRILTAGRPAERWTAVASSS